MEATKANRVQKELDELNTLFSDLGENEKRLVEGLIQNSAFMRVTLDDLQEQIDNEGVVDEYQNGAAQFGKKISATIQSYNALMKNYLAVQKKLHEMLPPEKKKCKLSKFAESYE